MLTGNLVRVRTNKLRVLPLYLHRESVEWLSVAESLLDIFRSAAGSTRGEIESAIDELFGSGQATLAHRGLARVLEDRSEFEVVADLDPEELRDKLFRAAALFRTAIARKRAENQPETSTGGFRRDDILAAVAKQAGITPEQAETSLFADLKDENRLLKFEDISAQRLIDRYNVALAQAVVLRATKLQVEIRQETPARIRQLFRMLKFHRLMFQAGGDGKDGIDLTIEGPLSLFQSTTKYGLQMALWLPTLLNCHDFRMNADLLWGARKEHRTFHLSREDGLVSHLTDTGGHRPPEIDAFATRFRQIAIGWDLKEADKIFRFRGEAGEPRVWMPDYLLHHQATGFTAQLEILGYWRSGSIGGLIEQIGGIPGTAPIWAVSDKMRVDESTDNTKTEESIVYFREIPSAPDILATAEKARRRSS
jgi:predicted nuclease of restriction endonuclease-like RecB superfamily